MNFELAGVLDLACIGTFSVASVLANTLKNRLLDRLMDLFGIFFIQLIGNTADKYWTRYDTVIHLILIGSNENT